MEEVSVEGEWTLGRDGILDRVRRAVEVVADYGMAE